jgi:hypothetical protein
MPQIPFDDLPEHARLWVFAADRELSPEESDRLLAASDAFLGQWAAHGAPLACARDLRYDRFLLVGVDERAAGVSGCSIDALTRTLKQLGGELGVDFMDNSPVLYREGAAVQRVSRAHFGELAESGAVSLATPVFDNTVATVGDLRAGRWEKPAGESWHGNAFF